MNDFFSCLFGGVVLMSLLVDSFIASLVGGTLLAALPVLLRVRGS